MSQGVNKVTLLGNLGADPEVRYMPSGDAVANLSVATSNSWKDRETGEWQEHTEWHRVVVKKHLAERARDRLKKGSQPHPVPASAGAGGPGAPGWDDDIPFMRLHPLEGG